MKSRENYQNLLLYQSHFKEENHSPLQFVHILIYIDFLLVCFELLDIFYNLGL